jgi:hypothetical protein
VKNQQLLLKVEGDWAEVFFDLKGDRDERVRVEVFHPDAIEDIDPITLPAYFNVSGSSVGEDDSNQRSGNGSGTRDRLEGEF